MEQQKEKTGPKGPRNKVKQVILIEGYPGTRRNELCATQPGRGNKMDV